MKMLDEGDKNFLSRKELLISCLLGMFIMNSARKIKDKDNLRGLPQIKKNTTKENMSSTLYMYNMQVNFCKALPSMIKMLSFLYICA